jgi:hypothetical protein
MKEIKLTQGKVALVDDEDFEYLNQWKWCAGEHGKTFYVRRNGYINGKRRTIQMHWLIMGDMEGKEIDHKDGNGLNNQRDNLRFGTHRQNGMNCRKRGSKSKYKGVYIQFVDGKCPIIGAGIKLNGKSVYIGRFKTEEEAARKYDEIALKEFGEFANINFKTK